MGFSGSRGSAGLGGTQESSSFTVPGDSTTAWPSGHYESLGYKRTLSDLSFSNLYQWDSLSFPAVPACCCAIVAYYCKSNT